MNIREKLSRIQYEFKSKKSRYNSFGKYNFRSAEDILESLKPLNEKYGVNFSVVGRKANPEQRKEYFYYDCKSKEREKIANALNEKYGVYFTVKENLTLGEFPILHSTAIMVDAESGETIEATAIVGVDLNAKGQQMPQRFGSASSYGKKYALGNLLLIDDTADADATNNHSKKANPKPDSFKQSIDYLKSAPEDKKSTVLQLILSKHGDKFSEKQKEALQRLT